MWDLHDVRRAISIEQDQAKEPMVFLVDSVSPVRGYLRLQLRKKPGRRASALDESFEQARAWWPGEPPGHGLVKMVDPDAGEIVLRTSGAPPELGSTVLLYPDDFLQALRACWDAPARSAAALSVTHQDAAKVLPHPRLNAHLPLRTRQRDALALSGSRIGLLHRSPGTGKTYTLGANAAGLLAGTPWRVLVTATTNAAVDQALLSIDDALMRIQRPDLRQHLVRLGAGFDAQRYRDRRHLLPATDDAAFEDLVLHQASQPSRKDVAAWITWRERERALRAKLRIDPKTAALGRRIVAATAASIFFNFDTYEVAPWNLLVVDEASQLPAAAAAMLATLADRTLFAGDPKQLPAVVQSEHPLCERYLGRTAFDVFDGKAPSVRLNEQSRMAPDICEVVSKVFYRGELVVATDKGIDAAWCKDREVPRTAAGKVRPVRVVAVDEEAQWSSKYQGQIRYSSAIAAAAAVEMFASAGTAEEDIWVLTPFRAQRALMRNILHAKGRKLVQVSTVHRAQGGERRVVLFDPVDAASKFLNGPLGDKLINVALSRAMAHVSMFISGGDLNNPRIRQIAELVRVHAMPVRGRKQISLTDLLKQFGATPAAHGQTIAVGDVIGSVIRFEGDGQVVIIRCHDSGRERRFKTRMHASA